MEITIQDFRNKIQSFRDLKPNWDSYGAAPPSEIAIENCLKGLEDIDKRGFVPDWIETGSDNSIIMEVNVGDYFEEWDFYNDGEVEMSRISFN